MNKIENKYMYLKNEYFNDINVNSVYDLHIFLS